MINAVVRALIYPKQISKKNESIVKFSHDLLLYQSINIFVSQSRIRTYIITKFHSFIESMWTIQIEMGNVFLIWRSQQVFTKSLSHKWKRWVRCTKGKNPWDNWKASCFRWRRSLTSANFPSALVRRQLFPTTKRFRFFVLLAFFFPFTRDKRFPLAFKNMFIEWFGLSKELCFFWQLLDSEKNILKSDFSWSSLLGLAKI